MLTQHAERLGYRCIRVAEHHNSRGFTTAATSIVLSHIAAATSSIRVGAGSIMLLNHAPYAIAEQFGTLEHHLNAERTSVGPFYGSKGPASTDPELMIRTLLEDTR